MRIGQLDAKVRGVSAEMGRVCSRWMMNPLLVPAAEYIWHEQREHCGGWRRVPGRLIDLHCHSTWSDEHIRWLPGLTFHPLLGPRELYELAKRRGMDYVTITDHDTIDGCKALLDECGPLDDFIVGEEVTTRFPEDGTVIHVNVYDIDEAQHREIQRLRGDVRDLADYLHRLGKLCVLNHMTWTQQHRPLKTHHIETMVELFGVFEVLNGTRSYAHNAFAHQVAARHGKVGVAGSDSHTDRVGTTYTVSAGETAAELLANIRSGRAAVAGAFGTPERLREDVWLTLHVNVQRRLDEAGGAWYRLACRTFERVGRLTYPLVCLGYHARQNLLIRRSLQAAAL